MAAAAETISELVEVMGRNGNGVNNLPAIYDRHQTPISLSSPGIVDFEGPKEQQFIIMRKIWQAQRLAEEYITRPLEHKLEVGLSNAQFWELTQNVIERQRTLLNSLNGNTEP